MKQPLFFKNVVPLDKDLHRNWHLSGTDNFEFARKTNAVALSAVEFRQLVREYPIVFVEENDIALPIALLGVQRDENLFINDAGGWDASYIPAYVRMYPFVLSQPQAAGNQTVCIDEAYAGFSQQGGEKLFGENGEQSEFLGKAIQFLREYHSSRASTQVFGKLLKELDVLEPMTAKGEVKGGEAFALSGFQVVKREKLQEIPDEKVLQLAKNGGLELIYLHLASIENFKSLVERAGKPDNKPTKQGERSAKQQGGKPK